MLIRKIGTISYSVRWRNTTIIQDLVPAKKILNIFDKRSLLNFWESIVILRLYVALKEYYDYSPISTYTESCRYSRNDRDCKVVDLWNTRNRYVVIESLDFMRNIFWLASCFFKMKKPNSHFLGNQSGIAGFPIFILK